MCEGKKIIEYRKFKYGTISYNKSFADYLNYLIKEWIKDSDTWS